jgi:hypothetical protein
VIEWIVAMAAETAAAPPVSFATDIAPLLRTRCATCHLTGNEAGEIALHPKAAYANLVGVKATVSAYERVKAGAPDESYMVMKLEGTHLDNGGAGARMPFAAPPLEAEKIEMIRRWIAEGAREN